MNNITKSIVFSIIAIFTLLGFSSCSNEPAEPCSTMQSYKANFEAKAQAMRNSLTPWGAKSDLSDIRIIWNNMITHAHGCKQCKAWIKKKDGESIETINSEMQTRFNILEKELDNGTGEFIENFIGGFLIGAGLL